MRVCILALFLAGCGTAVPIVVPARLEGPWRGGAADETVLEARRLLDAGQPRQALELLDPVLVDAGGHVDARRLRQDILRERGRLGLLLWESEQGLQARPDDPVELYLRGRIVSFPDKLDLFARAARLSPESFWGWLGLAFALRVSDPDRALQTYRQLYESSERNPLAGVAFAAWLRQMGELESARAVYRELQNRPEMPGVGDLGLAETWMIENEPRRAWEPMLSALRLRPFDPGVKQLVGDLVARGISADQLSQLLDILRADPERLGQFARGAGKQLLASLFLQAGGPQAARLVLEREPDSHQQEVGARRMRRQLLLANGDLVEFLRVLREDYPDEFLADETNQVRGLWLQLLSGPWADRRDPLADSELSVALVSSMLEAGLIREADMVASMARLRHRSRRLLGLQEQARRVEHFENKLRRLLYGGYLNGGDGPDLRGLLDELRRVSVEVLGEDVVGEPEVFHVPLVGDLVNPFSEGLGTWFASYNRHLVLGQRSGRPVEGMLLTRLSVRDLEAVPALPLPARCLEVIGENRGIRTLSDVGGGDLAGVALLNHYVVDMDQVRGWAANLQDRRQIAAEDGLVLLTDPLPGEVRPWDPVDAHWRLTVQAEVPDQALVAAVLDMIRWHERAHLVDSFHYLPVESNLLRNLGLLLGNGFSPLGIEAEMEARAETAALALSPHTQLVLAHVSHFLEPQDPGSSHALGFRRLAERLVRALQEDGVAPGMSRVSRWHLLDEERVRRVGRRLLEEHW